MTIKINGKQTETQSENLGRLAEELALPAQGVAMAISGKMIPRQNWADTPLVEGTDVFIIKAAYGG
ncbi:MAG: sulfur carrier protein ThiS [Candidatus Cryptobacteroides sp.]